MKVYFSDPMTFASTIAWLLALWCHRFFNVCCLEAFATSFPGSFRPDMGGKGGSAWEWGWDLGPGTALSFYISLILWQLSLYEFWWILRHSSFKQCNFSTGEKREAFFLSTPRTMVYEKVKVEKVKNVQVTISSKLHGLKELSIGETEFTKVGSYMYIEHISELWE